MTTRRGLFATVAGFIAAAFAKTTPAKPRRGHMSDCALHNEPVWPKGPCDCGLDNSKQMFVSSVEHSIIHSNKTTFCLYVDGFRWYANFIPSLEWAPPRLSPSTIFYLRNNPCALGAANPESIPT